ncbi:hypothetical protein [Streptomyces sp. NPDC002690]
MGLEDGKGGAVEAGAGGGVTSWSSSSAATAEANSSGVSDLPGRTRPSPAGRPANGGPSFGGPAEASSDGPPEGLPDGDGGTSGVAGGVIVVGPVEMLASIPPGGADTARTGTPGAGAGTAETGAPEAGGRTPAEGRGTEDWRAGDGCAEEEGTGEGGAEGERDEDERGEDGAAEDRGPEGAEACGPKGARVLVRGDAKAVPPVAGIGTAVMASRRQAADLDIHRDRG